MNESILENNIHHGSIEGKRKKGRPNWMNDLFIFSRLLLK